MSHAKLTTLPGSMPPEQIVATLERLRNRVKGLSVLYGIGLVILSMCGLLVLGALVDYVLRLEAVPRLIGLLTALGLIGWAFWKYIWKPATKSISVGDIAGRVEETIPEFDDRLRSSLEFMHDPDLLSTEPLRRLTVAQAGTVAAGVNWSSILRPRSALVTSGGAAGAVLILLIIALLLGPLAGTILGRLIDPLNPNHQWPKRFGVAPLVLPEKHPAGRPLEITATLTKGEAGRVEPVVYYQVGTDGSVRQQLMSRRDDGTFTASVDPRLAEGSDRGDLRVWVVAGDDQTAPQRVSVVARPALQSAMARVAPPSYVPQDSPASLVQQQDLTAGPLLVGDGSTVTLSFAFSQAIATTDETPAVKLQAIGDEPLPQFNWTTNGNNIVTATYTARQSARFEIVATGLDGFESEASPVFEIGVRPDQLPLVQIDQPRRNESRTPEAIVRLEAIGEDDYGFEYVNLVVSRLVPAGRDDGWTTETPLLGASLASTEETGGNNGAGLRYRFAYDWNLAEVAQSAGGAELKPGDTLEFFVRGKDNFALEGREHEAAESGRLRITIISQQELNRRVIRDLQAVKDEVAATRRRQESSRRESAEWAAQVAERAELDAADQEAADRLSRQQSAIAAQTKRLAEKAAQTGQALEDNRSPAEDLKELTKSVAEELDQAAEGPMAQAALAQVRAAGGNDSQQRSEDAAETEARQQEAIERLDRVMEEMEAIGSLRQSIDAVAQLLEQQRQLREATDATMRENVGRKRSEMSEEDQAELDRLADEQEKLAEQTDGAVQQMSEQAEQMPEDDPSAQAMKKAAQAAQQQQVSNQQRRAAQESRQNSRSGTQQSQQQAEIGLQLVLSQLRDAEREQLRQLERQLAELAEQIERLLERQAGHNVDNLTLRGVPEDEAFAALVLEAARDDENAVEPAVNRLSSQQEQTERNTRDLSRPAEQVPEGSAIAESLTRAASRMERAAVFIRQEDLTAAYEPPQIQALSALRDALAATRKQQEQVQEEIEEQERAAIRDTLVTIRDAQAAEVNEPTGVIETKRLAGELDRRDSFQPRTVLSPRQTELAGQIAEVEQTLADVGGVAFVYAGKQTRQGMEGVALRLMERDTSVATQAEQVKIVAQLDAMIESLTLEEDPNDDRFDRNSSPGNQGEGGEQQQGPQLPPEAELKLVRKLQEAVNGTTEALAGIKQQGDAAQQPPELDERLAATAAEQGELRGVLDQMLRSYSEGQSGFGPEPDPQNALPEESGDTDQIEQQLDDRDLLDDLLGDGARDNAGGAGEMMEGGGGEGEGNDEQQPQAGGGMRVRQVGDYMGRSRQRLDLERDPGPVTQVIQKRILEGIDNLIDEARNQQQNQSSSSSSSSQTRRPQQQPQPGEQQANAGGQQPGAQQPGEGEAPDNAQDGPAGTAPDLSRSLEETLAGWGGLTPRQREAILDTRGDQALEMYRALTEQFYKKLNEQEEDD